MYPHVHLYNKPREVVGIFTLILMRGGQLGSMSTHLLEVLCVNIQYCGGGERQYGEELCI
jgi:hypothetical protein